MPTNKSSIIQIAFKFILNAIRLIESPWRTRATYTYTRSGPVYINTLK